jgi:DNA-binding NarL/FixJ family response regulator
MRVLLAEGSTLFGQALHTLLRARPDIDVVGEATDGWEAVTESRRLTPDLVILELGIPSSPGLDHLSQIKEDAPETRVLVLTDSGREEDLWQTLRRGASGFILKNTSPEQLFRAIEAVMRGELAVSPSVSGNVLRGMVLGREETPRSRTRLTPREKEVLALLSRGRTDRDIGQQLSLSVSTVGHYVHSILRKLNVKNRVQAATLATAGGQPLGQEVGGTS